MSDRILSFILAMGLACLSLTAAEESAYAAGNGAPADFALGTEPWFITPVPDGEQAVVEALEFSYTSNTILRATGNVVMAYGDYRVYSDSVEYNTVTKILTSPGWTRVTYTAPEDLYEAMNKTSIAVDNEMGPFCYEILGENVIFNLENYAGQFENAHAKVDFGNFKDMEEGRWYEKKWYIYGKTLVKDPYENVLHVTDGRCTTCPPEYKSALYSFEAKDITVAVPDLNNPMEQSRVTARNCLVKFEGVPFLWLPQVTYTPSEDDNPFPVQVKAGYDSRKGGFFDLALDVYHSKELRLTPHIGYYSKHGISFGLDGSYNVVFTNVTTIAGEWESFFIDDTARRFIQEKDKHNKKDEKQFRYRFLWNHVQTFGPGAGWLNRGLLSWQIDVMKDMDVVHEFYREDYNRYGQRDTWLDFTIPIGEDNEVSFYAVKQVNSFYTTYERLPELRHVFRKRRIMELPALKVPVYYESKTTAGYYHYVQSDKQDAHASYTMWQAQTDHKISMPKRFFNFLNVEPYVGFAMDFGNINNYNDGEEYDYVWKRGRINPSARSGFNRRLKLRNKTVNFPVNHWNQDYNRYTRMAIDAYRPQDEGAFFRAMPYGGVDVNFKLHRTYNLEGTYAGELMRKYLQSDSEKIRHLIEPKGKIFGNAAFGTESGLAAGADLGIRNAFQIERKGNNANLIDFTGYISQRYYHDEVYKSQDYRHHYKYRGKYTEGKAFREYQASTAVGFAFQSDPTDWLNIQGDLLWDLDKYKRITFANLGANMDATRVLQKALSHPSLPRWLRGRKDELILNVSYRYLYDYSNLISAGGRFWFDDFTPWLSLEMQQKTWARELTRGWGFGSYMRFEAQKGDLQEMEFTLYKNWKKCIDTSVSYRLRDNNDHSVYVTFWLTAYPKSKINLGN